MITTHVWTVAALTLLVAVNIAVILVQRQDRALKRYLRIQATLWTTLMSMILFTGAAVMAYLHLDFSLKIFLMIGAAVALISLEVRRHLRIKRSRPDQPCFAEARKSVLRYYIFQLLWLVMVGGMTPMMGV